MTMPRMNRPRLSGPGVPPGTSITDIPSMQRVQDENRRAIQELQARVGQVVPEPNSDSFSFEIVADVRETRPGYVKKYYRTVTVRGNEVSVTDPYPGREIAVGQGTGGGGSVTINQTTVSLGEGTGIFYVGAAQA